MTEIRRKARPPKSNRALSSLAALQSQIRRRGRAFVAPPSVNPEEHWLRQKMNESIAAEIKSLNTQNLTAVEIGGFAHQSHGWSRFRTLDYPDFDLCNPTEGTGEFDVVICEQVLEHVLDPWRAAESLRQLCSPGGLVIVSTPFLVRVHELPEYGLCDYWRFTPRGLKTLLERAGLEVRQVDSWGNRHCLVANLDHWSSFRSWHPLRNEVDLPIQVWAFARRPVKR